MSESNNILKVCSINDIFCREEQTEYRIPIYQRNYAWKREEIDALIRDVYDSMNKNKSADYYIGTLVTYKRDDNVYEVIDGQQRLTTIFIILRALNVEVNGRKLAYSARKVSDKTIRLLAENASCTDFGDVYDKGIKYGYECAKTGLDEIVGKDRKEEFKRYLSENVRIIRYQVPRDVDLNHYFEVMNSRGEQLEKHEIVKAKLADALHEEPQDMELFCQIWDDCSDMSIYIQQKRSETENNIKNGEKAFFERSREHQAREREKRTIKELLATTASSVGEKPKLDRNDSFQPIIDFPNFLLIVLKLTRIRTEDGFNPLDFALDDKEIINEFEKVKITSEFVRAFAFNMLKAKYYLDNYVVHHVNGNDKEKENPWKLQRYNLNGETEKTYLKDLAADDKQQEEMVQLLSMFEVAFTARQRKNYLFYVMLHLFENDNVADYLVFLRKLADKYFFDVYLDGNMLNERRQPRPNSFDTTIVDHGRLSVELVHVHCDFDAIYPNDEQLTIPLYIFVYTDYRLWKKYADEVRGSRDKKGQGSRELFFNDLGCSDFGLDAFKDFYFSRTRKSLEHYYPKAKADDDKVKAIDINCFGNYAMIGADANSSGSDWSPKTKLDHYLDPKTNPVSVASLKFRVMLQMCKDNADNKERGDNEAWLVEDMKQHQKQMLSVIMKNQK